MEGETAVFEIPVLLYALFNSEIQTASADVTGPIRESPPDAIDSWLHNRSVVEQKASMITVDNGTPANEHIVQCYTKGSTQKLRVSEEREET